MHVVLCLKRLLGRRKHLNRDRTNAAWYDGLYSYEPPIIVKDSR